MSKYAVRQSLTEVYDIIVDANSEDEAIELANAIDLDNWVNVSTTTNLVKAAEYKLGTNNHAV